MPRPSLISLHFALLDDALIDENAYWAILPFGHVPHAAIVLSLYLPAGHLTHLNAWTKSSELRPGSVRCLRRYVPQPWGTVPRPHVWQGLHSDPRNVYSPAGHAVHTPPTFAAPTSQGTHFLRSGLEMWLLGAHFLHSFADS